MYGSVTARTRCGQLRGLLERSREGFDYCAFKGVPYAVPPVGKLRFRDPIPAQPWQGVRDATKFGQFCAQYDMATRSVQGSDDCLYLNVYVKSIEPNARLPVMVWIHGGAFMFGSGDDVLYGPDYLLRRDIVLVTFNYRVGALGFLNFEHKEASGNMGLKDQVMVLRWVQENIKDFGGDPENITIFGESAGAASVHYLTLSKLSKGLFHKAIIQSGIACTAWASSSSKDNAYKLCRLLGNESTNPKELVEFLRTVEISKFVEAQRRVQSLSDKMKGLIPFCPCVDSESSEPFLPVHPSEALKEGIHVPLIVGHNVCEGTVNLIGLNDKGIERINSNFEDTLNSTIADVLKRVKMTPDDLKRVYFGDERLSKDNVDKFVNLCTDFLFIEGTHRLLSAQAKYASTPTYTYCFTYDGDFSLIKTMTNTTIPGSSHFDEVQYLFSMRMFDKFNMDQLPKGTPAHRVMEKMTEMWVNFAKYGKPTLTKTELITTDWLPINNERIFRTLIIDNQIKMENVKHFDDQLSLRWHAKNKL